MFKQSRLVLACLIIMVIVTGCGQKNPVANSSLPATTTNVFIPRGTVGTIETSKAVIVSTTSITEAGGKISITEQDSPLAGMEISVPANSYTIDTPFKVSYAAIEKHAFGNNFNPVTPLITIENGGAYSADLMTVTIPVDIPADSFAMGFYYDEKTRTLEGMPLLDFDDNSITIATRHFSSFTVGTIANAALYGDIDTGFKPGVDDWQLYNTGSILVGSQCAGQSISSIWYYNQQPDGGTAHLFNRYDNDGNTDFKTPDFEHDDSLAIKLTTSLQVDYEATNLASERKFRESSRIDDRTTINLFRYSMLVTGSPQLLITAFGNGGHALVAYKILDDAIYVADPNAPGDTDVKYAYIPSTGKFQTDNTVYYGAISALVSWQQIAQRWAELRNGTIGDDRFPTYEIKVLDEKGNWIPLPDTYVSKEKTIDVKLVPGPGNAKLTNMTLFYVESTRVDGLTKKTTLKPGSNRIGIRVQGMISEKEGTNWAGFKYYDVIYSSLEIDPSTLEGKINESYTFTAKEDNPPENSSFIWTINGETKQNNVRQDYTTSFTTPGNYTIGVSLVGGDGKEIASAKSAVSIKAVTTAAMDKLKILQGMGKVSGNLMVTANQIWTKVSGETTTTTAKPYNYRLSYSFEKITWQGTSFSGSLDTGGGWTMSLAGTVSDDGSKIISMKVVLNPDSTRPEYISTWTQQMAGVPLDFGVANVAKAESRGPAVQSYFTKIEESSRTLNSTTGGLISELRLDSPQWTEYIEGAGPFFFINFGK